MPNERYYTKALKTILMVPNFQMTTSVSESSPMEKVKKIAEVALAGGDLQPFEDFLAEFDPAEEAVDE